MYISTFSCLQNGGSLSEVPGRVSLNPSDQVLRIYPCIGRVSGIGFD